MKIKKLNESRTLSESGYKITIEKDGKTFNDYCYDYREESAIKQMKARYGDNITIKNVIEHNKLDEDIEDTKILKQDYFYDNKENLEAAGWDELIQFFMDNGWLKGNKLIIPAGTYMTKVEENNHYNIYHIWTNAGREMVPIRKEDCVDLFEGTSKESVSGKYGKVSYEKRADGLNGETPHYAGYHLFSNDGKYTPYWAGETSMGSSYATIDAAVKGIDSYIDKQKASGKMKFIKAVNESIEVATIADYITDHYEFDDIDDKYACINSIKDSHKDTISYEELQQFIGAHNGTDLEESFDVQYIATSIDSLNDYCPGLGDACKDLKNGDGCSYKGYDIEFHNGKYNVYLNESVKSFGSKSRRLSEDYKGYDIYVPTDEDDFEVYIRKDGKDLTDAEGNRLQFNWKRDAREYIDSLGESVEELPYMFHYNCNNPTYGYDFERMASGLGAKKVYAKYKGTGAGRYFYLVPSEDVYNELKAVAKDKFTVDMQKLIPFDSESYPKVNKLNEARNWGLREANIEAIEYFIEFEHIYKFPKDRFGLDGWEEFLTSLKYGMEEDLETAENIMEYLKKEINFNNKHPEIFEDDPQSELTLEIYNKVKREYDKEIAQYEGLNEASYGGAFDIADDQFFTKDDLLSFADEVLGHVAETFNGIYDVGGVWFEDGNVITQIVDDSGNEYEDTTKVNMRRIREPWHLKRAYAAEVASKIIQQIKDIDGDVVTEELNKTIREDMFGNSNIIKIGSDLVSKSGHKIHIDDMTATISPFENNAIVTFYYSFELTDGTKGSSKCTTYDLKNMLKESLKEKLNLDKDGKALKRLIAKLVVDDDEELKDFVMSIVKEVLNERNGIEESLNEDLMEDADAATRYLDVDIPEMCAEIVNMIPNMTESSLRVVANKARDFYAFLEGYATRYGSKLPEQLKESRNKPFELKEDLEVPTLEGPAEGAEFALADLINTAMQSELTTVNEYNTLALNARAEGFDDIASVIDEINTEENKHIGQLQELLKTISPNARAIDAGETEGADQLVSVDANNITEAANTNSEEISNEVEVMDTWEKVLAHFKHIEDVVQDGEAVTALIDEEARINKGNPAYDVAYQKWNDGEY